MEKIYHEIRDPLYAFIRFSADERKIIDSRPFQRLRNIHQLAMTFLVYPGATHTRFEHSLGVMELAGRVFDTITRPDAIQKEIRELIPELEDSSKKLYWRSVLRIAALCHDLGHLPFSHAAEKELLPDGWDHERLTMEIIKSQEMREIWDNITPSPKIEHIAKLALRLKKGGKCGLSNFSIWETILSELITGDAFGADRIDYLLRDSYHIGVAYGKFDHYRLIDTMRILSPLYTGDTDTSDDFSKEPMLGIEEGGLFSAEALLLARYFMFSQVYCHHVRRIYDIHLKDFLASWLPERVFSNEISAHLDITDNEVFSALYRFAATDSGLKSEYARRITRREHFRELYRRYPEDIAENPNAVEAVYYATVKEFGEKFVRKDLYLQEGNYFDFPVLRRDGKIVSSLSLSTTLQHIPPVSVGYVFIERSHFERSKKWLESHKSDILKLPQ